MAWFFVSPLFFVYMHSIACTTKSLKLKFVQFVELVFRFGTKTTITRSKLASNWEWCRWNLFINRSKCWTNCFLENEFYRSLTIKLILQINFFEWLMQWHNVRLAIFSSEFRTIGECNNKMFHCPLNVIKSPPATELMKYRTKTERAQYVDKRMRNNTRVRVNVLFE